MTLPRDTREVVHAMGKAAALCGAELLLVPMNFAPHSVFGVGPRPLPRGGKAREWCESCLARWREVRA